MWDDHHKAPYMFKDTKWVSYDNETSIRMKTEFAHDNGLAGVMTWSIDTDDFRGSCGGRRYPLLRTINKALYDRSQGLTAAAPTTTAVSASTTVLVSSALLLFARGLL